MKTIKKSRPQGVRVVSQDLILNFETPLVSPEWVKLETSKLLQTGGGLNKNYAKVGHGELGRGHVT